MRTALKLKASYVGATLLLLAGLLLSSAGLRGWAARAVYFVRGNAAYRAGSYGDAEVWYRKAVWVGATSGVGQYNLGNALYLQGRYVEAVQYYKQAGRTGTPGIQTKAWANLGNAYYQAGQVRASYAAYRKALLLSPQSASVRQDFLFVHEQLATKRTDQSPHKDSSATPPQDQNQPAESQGDGATQKESPAQPVAQTEQQLSEKEVQELLGTITQNESRLRAKLNGSRPRGRKPVSDEKDY